MKTTKIHDDTEETVYIVPCNYEQLIKPNLQSGAILAYKIIGFCKINNQYCFKVISLQHNIEMHMPFSSINSCYELISESQFLADKLSGKF